jgi:subtilisin family serine protease
MYTLKVNTQKVNIRNTPAVDTSFANWVGELPPGELHTAQEILADGNGELWWKDTLNRFTLATASDVVNFQDPGGGPALIGVQNYLQERFDRTSITNKIDYAALLRMSETLKSNLGRGVTVAIMDYAIPENLQFTNPVTRPYPGFIPVDPHAAFIGGLIAGNTDLLSGIAPQVQLVELPIFDSSGFRRDPMIKNAIAWLTRQPGPVIVNCSQGLDKSCPPELFNLPNIFLVAAAGTDDELTEKELFRPASSTKAISVGAASSSWLNKTPPPSFNSRLDFFFADFEYVSLDLPSNRTPAYCGIPGSSFATGIVSAMAALLLSANPAISSIEQLRNQLATFARPLSDKASFQFLNPIKTS